METGDVWRQFAFREGLLISRRGIRVLIVAGRISRDVEYRRNVRAVPLESLRESMIFLS